MNNPYRKVKQNKRFLCLTIASFTAALFLFYLSIDTHNEEAAAALVQLNSSPKPPIPNAATATAPPPPPPPQFTPTLHGKKVFFAITTVGLGQFSYFENMIDSVRDLCEAGAHVSLHIISSNCDASIVECEVKETTGNDTIEDNFSVETLSHLNERVRCRNPEGRLESKIHLVSPDWGKQICDHHRLLFYEHLEEGYDVFIHTEDDLLIRPTHVISFMDEMEKLRLLVGDERVADYCIGFMRYENQERRFDKRRVIWEFEWDSYLTMINHTGIENKYFISPPWHHQGMSMATKQQLLAWKTRAPDCHFHKIVRRYGYHRERITGGLDLYNKNFCNVTQLLPLDTLEDFLINHMPNKNYNRMPLNILTTRNLHKLRVNKMQSFGEDKRIRVDGNGEYDGIELFEDERDHTKRMHFDLTEYHAYVESGGRLTEKQLEYWEWEEQDLPEYMEQEPKYYEPD